MPVPQSRCENSSGAMICPWERGFVVGGWREFSPFVQFPPLGQFFSLARFSALDLFQDLGRKRRWGGAMQRRTAR